MKNNRSRNLYSHFLLYLKKIFILKPTLLYDIFGVFYRVNDSAKENIYRKIEDRVHLNKVKMASVAFNFTNKNFYIILVPYTFIKSLKLKSETVVVFVVEFLVQYYSFKMS